MKRPLWVIGLAYAAGLLVAALAGLNTSLWLGVVCLLLLAGALLFPTLRRRAAVTAVLLTGAAAFFVFAGMEALTVRPLATLSGTVHHTLVFVAPMYVLPMYVTQLTLIYPPLLSVIQLAGTVYPSDVVHPVCDTVLLPRAYVTVCVMSVRWRLMATDRALPDALAVIVLAVYSIAGDAKLVDCFGTAPGAVYDDPPLTT